MKIRTRVKIAGALTVLILLAYWSVILHLDRTMTHLAQAVREANEFELKINILRNLTMDYLLYRTERAQRQWSAVYAEVLQMLGNQEYLVLQSEYGIGDVSNKLKIVGDTFSRLMTLQQPAGPDNPEGGTRGELQTLLTTQLLLATQDLLTRFLNLTETINGKLISTQRLITSLDILTLFVLGILIISNTVFLQRSVVRPVLQLHAGARIIGAGNLDYQVGMTSKDEIGELSQAFDRMTANLRKVTVSRDELVREVAVRQRAEEALRESREDLSRAQAVAHTGSWRMNVQKNELTWSEENHRIFGIPPGTPMTYETFLGTIHPEDREYVDRKWMAALKGEPYNIEHRLIVDGEVKWVRERAELEFDSQGRLLGGFGTTQDITERKRAEETLQESEERLRQAAQAGHMFAFEWNPITDEVIRSEESASILGLSDDTAIHDTGQGFFAKILDEDRDIFVKTLQNLNPETDQYTANYRVVRSDTGKVIWLEEIARALFDGEGKLRRLYGMTMDITERKRAEEALRERSAELARAVADLADKNAEMERFTYMISHDLKSPLVTISTFLGFLEKDMASADTGRIDKDLQYLYGAADKMGRLLAELLEMSRIGRVVNQPVKVTFQEVVEEALNAVVGALAKRGLEVRVSDAEVILFGDRPRLVEIWQSLVENAVKFMGEQPAPRLEIGVERQEVDPVFFVCDNGIGIDPRYQKKIFGIFEKLDAGNEGTGIGLALAKRVVELYNGTMWVESAGLGQGACFRFTLPGAVKGSEIT